MKQSYPSCCLFVLSSLLIISNIDLSAQEKVKFLDARESDPIKMGWMTGAPPPKDKTIYPLPKPKDYDGPRTYYEYLPTVKKKGVHGEAFGYKTVNSDVLGWIIARVTHCTGLL